MKSALLTFVLWLHWCCCWIQSFQPRLPPLPPANRCYHHRSSFHSVVVGVVDDPIKLFATTPNDPPPSLEDLQGDTAASDEDDTKKKREEAKVLEEKKSQFEQLVAKVMATKNPDHIPSLLTKNIDFLLSMKGNDAVQIIQEICVDAKNLDDEEEGGEGESLLARTETVIDSILCFVEDFVEQAKDVDDKNKELLGRIVRTISKAGSQSLRNREELLDRLLIEEQDNLTAGFLRHVEGQCQRIASSKTKNSETTRLIEILRIIQARVVEELGKDMGEAAMVLGQLVAYETKSERLAVLNAGLTVRGLDFAHELIRLTKEALEGFERVQADPDLKTRVLQIEEGLETFVSKYKP